MRIEYAPLLQRQRDLYRRPRGMERFQEYLRSLIDDDADDVKVPPLVAINPMAREHLPALLDEYLALDADAQAELAVAAAAEALEDVPGEFKVSLVVVDDLKGGWTNRYAVEFGMRSGSGVRTNDKARRRQAWLTCPLWSSEPATAKMASEQVLLTVHRAAYRVLHGFGETLGEILSQEGNSMARAGWTQPLLEPDDLNYTRDVIKPLLGASDMATVVACLFGDQAARSLGFTPQGLSDRAGLALALHDAMACAS